MIVKIPLADEGVQLFDEIDHLRWYPWTKECGVSADEFIDLRPLSGTPAKNPKAVMLRFMNKNQTAETVVIAASPVYVMNNAGKTIERL